MSATIGNLPELAQFLNADVYQKDFRPVELCEFVKCGSDLVKIEKDGSSAENTFVYDRTVSFNVRNVVKLLSYAFIYLLFILENIFSTERKF